MKTRSDLVHRSRMGTFSIVTALAGTVVAAVTFAVLAGVTNLVLQHNDSGIEMTKAWDKAWDELGRRGVLMVAGALLVSYLIGTFVAGRMAWHRGWLRGLQSEIDLRDRNAARNERMAPVAVSAERRNGDTNGDAKANGNGHKAAEGADETIDVDGMTKDELYEMAQELDISGRSSMTKEDLARSVRRKRRSLSRPRSR